MSAAVVRWDPVHDGREAFLTCMWAQCAPGRPHGPLPRPGIAGEVSLDCAAAILLALLDRGLGLAVVGDHDSRVVGDRLCEMTGAEPTSVERAAFVLVTAITRSVAGRARRGTASAPELGATIVYALTPFDLGSDLGRDAGPGVDVELEGPGIDGTMALRLGLPASEVAARDDAVAERPLGVDLFVVAGHSVVALPRSTTLRHRGVDPRALEEV